MSLVSSGFKGLTQFQTKNFSSIDLLPVSALDVYKKSCYYSIDYKINEESDVKEAVNRFTAFNVSCLAVTNNKNEVIGVCSECKSDQPEKYMYNSPFAQEGKL